MIPEALINTGVVEALKWRQALHPRTEPKRTPPLDKSQGEKEEIRERTEKT